MGYARSLLYKKGVYMLVLRNILLVVLVGFSSLFAGDYVGLGYERSNFDDGQKYDFNYYVLSYSRIDKDYLFSAYMYYEPSETSTGTYDGIKYRYEDETLDFAATFAYKVLKADALYLAPYLSYAKSNSKTKETDLSNNSVETWKNKKNYLSLRVLVGYDYAEDSYIYIKTKLKELIQDEDRNTLPVTVGINHQVGQDYLVGAYLGKSLDNYKGYDNSWFGFDIGYRF
jgi:hypothetical protein